MWRAVAGAIVAVALMGGSARADVFVPDDPAPRDGECVAAAGDVIVTTRSEGRRSFVDISEAGGPWRRLRVHATDVAAAPGGWAAASVEAVMA